MGSLPGDRIKMSGEWQVESPNDELMSNWGVDKYSSPNSWLMRFCRVIIWMTIKIIFVKKSLWMIRWTLYCQATANKTLSMVIMKAMAKNDFLTRLRKIENIFYYVQRYFQFTLVKVTNKEFIRYQKVTELNIEQY